MEPCSRSAIPHPSEEEKNHRHTLHQLLKESPLPEEDLMANLPMYLYRKHVARLLFLNEIYQKILPVHGSIMRFGVYWGREMCNFLHLRGIYEPYNFSRRVIGFTVDDDSLKINGEDGITEEAKLKILGTSPSREYYTDYLNPLLDCQEKQSPLSHIRRFDLIPGNPCQTVPQYFKEHAESVVALAYFSFNLYHPTKICLEAIKDRLTKGSVLVFNELNEPFFPGEALALKEVFGLNRYPIRRVPYDAQVAYLVIE